MPTKKTTPERRDLLVFGEKTFKISIPGSSKITFGPFSPPTASSKGYGGIDPSRAIGTLRIYDGTKDNIIACFTGVRSFRELSLDYQEEVAVEEGARIWKSDEKGYVREEKVSSQRKWIEPALLEQGEDDESPF